jgi:capsular polysaccharide biosynthesis protein
MSDSALDLRRSAEIQRRHIIFIGVAAMLGLLAGAAFALLNPPMLTSKALVLLPPAAKGAGVQPTRNTGTQLVLAASGKVLEAAVPRIHPPVPVTVLRDRIHVSSPSLDIIAFTAQGSTAAQAEGVANAVASSYIAYISPPGSPRALLLQPAANATGTPLAMRLALDGGVGALIGILAGTVAVLAIGRADRRLRRRDEIADATGVPVLASVPVRRPSDPAGWTRLFDDYQPGATQAWTMREALRLLGITDAGGGKSARLAMVSLSSDRGALALGPQLATYAASLGIPTTLVLGPHPDAKPAASLRVACANPQPAGSGRALRVSVADGGEGAPPESPLTVIVAVVDPQAPRVPATMHATTTMLGVSAGAATAEELARVTVSAAGDGRRLAGILVADPDPADETTGRVPQPAHRRPVSQPTAR